MSYFSFRFIQFRTAKNNISRNSVLSIELANGSQPVYRMHIYKLQWMATNRVCVCAWSCVGMSFYYYYSKTNRELIIETCMTKTEEQRAVLTFTHPPLCVGLFLWFFFRWFPFYALFGHLILFSISYFSCFVVFIVSTSMMLIMNLLSKLTCFDFNIAHFCISFSLRF